MQAVASQAAGQAADAWAQVESQEVKGDAVAASEAAAQAVALQQHYNEQRAAAEAAAGQAAEQVRDLKKIVTKTTNGVTAWRESRFMNITIYMHHVPQTSYFDSCKTCMLCFRNGPIEHVLP